MLFELRMRRRKKKTWRHTERRGNGWRVQGGEFSSGSHSGWEMIFKTEFVSSLKNRTESKIASVPTNPASSLESGKFFTVHLLSDSSVLLLFLFPTIPGLPCPAACTRHLAALLGEPRFMQHAEASAPIRLISLLTLGNMYTCPPPHLCSFCINDSSLEGVPIGSF